MKPEDERIILVELTGAVIDALPKNISHDKYFKHQIPAPKLLRIKQIISKICGDR